MKTLKIGELTARIPVIQGGMGVGISLSGLAGSVAACGGVGVISTAQIGYRDPEFEKDPIKTNLRKPLAIRFAESMMWESPASIASSIA